MHFHAILRSRSAPATKRMHVKWISQNNAFFINNDKIKCEGAKKNYEEFPPNLRCSKKNTQHFLLSLSQHLSVCFTSFQVRLLNQSSHRGKTKQWHFADVVKA